MAEMLRLDQAAFYYPQGRWGLEETSLSVASGEGVLVTGPSGCGKSTFTRCLTGLIPHLYRGELTTRRIKPHFGSWLSRRVWSSKTLLDRCWLNPLKMRSSLVLRTWD